MLREKLLRLPLPVRKYLGRPLIALDKVFQEVIYPPECVTYSSYWEDLLVARLLDPVWPIFYLDIGAHHPKWISNTYHFYRRGCLGMCVEPNPKSARSFSRMRPLDYFLGKAVSVNGETSLTLYVPNLDPGGSTVERSNLSWVTRGINPIKVESLPMIEVLRLFQSRYHSPPDFVDIDVEGLDYHILRTFPFELCRPKTFCVETTYRSGGKERDAEIISLMRYNSYLIYCHADNNTIFISEEFLKEKNDPKKA